MDPRKRKGKKAERRIRASSDYSSESDSVAGTPRGGGNSALQGPVVSGVCMVVTILSILVVVTFLSEYAVYRYQMSTPQRQLEEAERLAMEAKVERLVQERMYEFRASHRSFDDLGIAQDKVEEVEENTEGDSPGNLEQSAELDITKDEDQKDYDNSPEILGSDEFKKEEERKVKAEEKEQNHTADFIQVLEVLYAPPVEDQAAEVIEEVEQVIEEEEVQVEETIMETITESVEEECHICETCPDELCTGETSEDPIDMEEEHEMPAVVEEEPVEEVKEVGTQTDDSPLNETLEHKFTMSGQGSSKSSPSMISKFFTWSTADNDKGCKGDVLRVGESLEAGGTLHNGCPSSELLLTPDLRECTPAFVHLTNEGILVVGEGENFEEMTDEFWRLDPFRNSKKNWRLKFSMPNLKLGFRKKFTKEDQMEDPDQIHIDGAEGQEVPVQEKILKQVAVFFERIKKMLTYPDSSLAKQSTGHSDGLNLHLQNDGTLILQDSHGSVLWTSMKKSEEISGDYITRVDKFGHLIVTLENDIHWADNYKTALSNYFQPKLDALKHC